ncbi:protein FAM228B isoform X4 [Struthio camelus]|uniref:protein FAM228B isoform X4 n=1 Tax=Struthio camelus TaxID=8801 RepID=UPI003603C00D
MRCGAGSQHSDLSPGPRGASPEPRFSSTAAKSSTANTFACSTCFGKKNATRDWLTQKSFLHAKEVDRYLRHNDFLNLRKKELLYKKWLRDVSEPLLRKIEDKIDSKSSEEIQKRNEEQLSLYLNYCKKKGYTALDTYNPSEYDPFFLKTCTDCWKVTIPTLQDPLLKDIRRKFTEKVIIKQCETGRLCSSRELNQLRKAELPLLPLSRQRMDAAEWLKVPHAFIASEAHRRKRQKVVEHHKDGKSSRHLSSS